MTKILFVFLEHSIQKFTNDDAIALKYFNFDLARVK